MKKFLNTWQHAASLTGAPFRVSPGLPVYPADVTTVGAECCQEAVWGVPPPTEGLARRAAAHYDQFTKPTTCAFTRWELALSTTYEEVAVGLLVVGWTQTWGHRTGYGCTPYFRYVTSGGTAVTYYNVADVPTEGDIAWDPLLKKYIARVAGSAERREVLSELVRAAADVQPMLLGWIDGAPARAVYSTGAVAQQTLLGAYGSLREQDPFYTPTRNAVTGRA